VRYLADIADTVRGFKQRAIAASRLAREIQQLKATAAMLQTDKPERHSAVEAVADLAASREARLDPQAKKLLTMWPAMQKAYAGDEYVVKIRDKEIRTALTHTTLSGSKIRKVVLPKYECDGEVFEVASAGQRAGQLPVHRRHLCLQARRRRPDAHVRRRRRRLPTNRRFKLLSAACRPSA
jgi:methylmalonyl-CoA mutase